ncbi:MAG: SUMF1/EgtB/PvdO family nonheme iron enzyme, partial [Bacteroidota bacterium]
MKKYIWSLLCLLFLQTAHAQTNGRQAAPTSQLSHVNLNNQSEWKVRIRFRANGRWTVVNPKSNRKVSNDALEPVVEVQWLDLATWKRLGKTPFQGGGHMISFEDSRVYWKVNVTGQVFPHKPIRITGLVSGGGNNSNSATSNQSKQEAAARAEAERKARIAAQQQANAKKVKYQELLMVANKYMNQGAYQKAISQYQQALRYQPNDSYAKSRMAEARQKLANQQSRAANYSLAVAGKNYEMVYVQGQTYTMGTNANPYGFYPEHEVTLSDFFIGKTEVTQALWQAVMGSNPSQYKCATCPVNNINFEDAQRFIRAIKSKT